MEKYRNIQWNKELEVIRETKRKKLQKPNKEYRYNNEKLISIRPQYTGRKESNLMLNTTLGIVIGGSILFLIISAARQLLDPHERVAAINDELQITSKIVSSSIRELANIETEKELNKKRELAKIEIEKEKQLEAIRLTRKAEEARKAKWKIAFNQFYKKAEKCYSPESKKIRVECANEYMRARKAFESMQALNNE